MTALAQALDRAIVIRAPRDLVFRYFSDSARWAAWWGQGSAIDATLGGRMCIRYPDGTEALGEVVEITPPERIVFTYGYAKGTPIPPGASRVTIELEAHPEGTRLLLTHLFDEPGVRDHHVQGWRYQLSLFSNIVANELYAGIGATIDAWFDTWAIEDGSARKAALAAIAAPSVRFHDRYSAVDGLADLDAQIAGAQRFMPGVRLHRNGGVRHCQGVALADWVARRGDQPIATGTSVFTFRPDAKLESIVALWN